MREIKFRCRDRSSKKIIAFEIFNTSLNDGYYYLDLRELDESGDIGNLICHTNYGEPPMPKPDTAIGGLIREEFTGLKDKNGAEIYEGDIVHMIWDNWLDEISFIKFDSGRFGYGSELMFSSLDCLIREDVAIDGYFSCFEVIGNIYENHELLK